jgi:hypothetical protein
MTCREDFTFKSPAVHHMPWISSIELQINNSLTVSLGLGCGLSRHNMTVLSWPQDFNLTNSELNVVMPSYFKVTTIIRTHIEFTCHRKKLELAYKSNKSTNQPVLRFWIKHFSMHYIKRSSLSAGKLKIYQLFLFANTVTNIMQANTENSFDAKVRHIYFSTQFNAGK